MDLADLRALLQVVEHGSFQRAAQALRVTRSGLRRHVDRLELELGVPLLSRGAKGIELTTAGIELADGAARLLRDATNLAERARSQSDDARGSVRFIIPTGMPSRPRVLALQRLQRLHPDLTVEVSEDEDPLSRLSEPFDLMLHYGRPPRREGWFSHVVLRLPIMLRASSAYLEEHGAPTSLDALAERPLLMWSAPGFDGPDLPLRGGGGVTASPRVRTSNHLLLAELAEAGAGILYAPVLPPSLGAIGEGLVPVLEPLVGGELSVRALAPRSSREDPKINALLENIRRLIAMFDGDPPRPPA